MREPVRMTLDFSPYFRLLAHKPKPENLTEQEIEKRLKKIERFTNDTPAYAGTIAYITFFACPAIGYGAMALGLAAPILWGLGGAYLIFKSFKPLAQAALYRAHNDIVCYTGELSKRAAARAVETQKELELQAQEAALRARRAQQAFEQALDDGLPLEKKIAVKSPFKLKPVAQLTKDVFDAEALPQGPGPGSISDPKVSESKVSAQAASSTPEASPPLSRGWSRY